MAIASHNPGIPRRRRLLRRATVVAAILIAWPAAAGAQTFVPTSVAGDLPIDEIALSHWMDAWFARQLADPEGGAPGGAVAVVEGSRILLVRGYGYANLERRLPATGSTVFRVGSLAKPVTATAVMQLVEAGRIDLRRPVSAYVWDVSLAAPFGRPITPFDLLTHTAGFDVRLEGTATDSDSRVLPLGDFLRGRLPPQIRPAGSAISYSDFGYALLGHLVEAQSGERFESYVDGHVFARLGMKASTFRFGPATERRAAVGYQRGPGGFRRALVVHPHIYPAAGLCTSAEDMSRFLLAELNEGRLAGTAILSPPSLAAMHRRQFSMADGVPGSTLGFFEHPAHGQRALVHGGGIRGFVSGLVLWPERRVGLFVVNNGDNDWIVRDLVYDFARKFLPGTPRPRAQRENGEPFEPFAGSYRPLTATVDTLEKAGTLRHGDVELAATTWGGLAVGGTRFVHVGAGAFVEDWGGGLLWVVNRSGTAAPLLVTADPVNGITVFERLPWYATARCHREVLYVCCLVFATVLFGAARRLVNRPSREPAAARRALAVSARTVLTVAALLNLLAVALLYFAFGSGNSAGMLFGLPRLVPWSARAGLAAAALCPVLVVGLWPVWRAREWPVGARLHFTAGVAAGVAGALWAHYWRLL
jgi:CubicO group peptidase (beta-lactamase class C family)